MAHRLHYSAAAVYHLLHFLIRLTEKSSVQIDSREDFNSFFRSALKCVLLFGRQVFSFIIIIIIVVIIIIIIIVITGEASSLLTPTTLSIFKNLYITTLKPLGNKLNFFI